MYVKDVLFSETSTPKHFSAEVILDKKAIFRFMKDWLESFEDLSKDTVFSIGNLDFEPDLTHCNNHVNYKTKYRMEMESCFIFLT